MVQVLSVVLFAAAVSAAFADAQSWSVGDGMVTYQILFSNWRNPDGLTYTGQRCDQIGSKCDTRFTGDFEIFGCNATEQRRMDKLTWPGPHEPTHWNRIGKRKYDPNSLTDFAYVNLTGVDCSDLCGIIVRLNVIDVDPLKNDIIDKYIGTLPGCQDLQVTRYEQQAQFSMPIALESISIALPQVPRHHQPNMNAIQQHQLHLKVRAWGVTASSGSTSTSSRNYSPYSPSASGTRTSGTQMRTQYGTVYNARGSSSSDDTTTESSLYGANRYSQSGAGFGSSSSGSSHDRHGYPSSSSHRTYSSVINP